MNSISTIDEAVSVGEAARKLIDAEAAKGHVLTATDAVDLVMASRGRSVTNTGCVSAGSSRTSYSRELTRDQYWDRFNQRVNEDWARRQRNVA